MISIILHYGAWYLSIGFVTAWLINQSIKYVSTSDPYTPGEVFVAILLWPLNVVVLIYGFISSFFK
jgi:hypothetical protein